MKNSDRFLNAFINIEMQLKEILKVNHLPFGQLVSRAAKQSDVIAYYEFDLIEYSQLRNAITHNRIGSNDEVIAEPHIEVVEAIETIAKTLNKPRKVLDVFSKDVVYVDIDEDLKSVINKKYQSHYSMIPVYRKKQYVGIIHDTMIARWVEEKIDDLNLEALSVSDLLKYKSVKDRVVFVDQNCSVFEALAIFTKRVNDGHHITAIIMTPNGQMNQLPIQILTMADIPTLLHERA